MSTELANPMFRSTGTRWADENPEHAAKALMLFADGASLVDICEECGNPHPRTIRAYLQHKGIWNACTKVIAQTARIAARQLAERLTTESHAIPIENVASALKTAVDVANALDGAPQTVIEHRHSHTHAIAEPTLDAIKAFKARLQPQAIIEAETIPEPQEPVVLPPQPAWEPGEMV